MRTLIPGTDHPYYLWQVLVQMVSMKDQDARWLLYVQREPSAWLQRIIDADVGDVVVFEDWERDARYNPAMKPWLVGKYLQQHHPIDDILVIDPDVLPTGNDLPAAREGVIWGTNTDSYTGKGYLEGRAALEPLCDFLGMPVPERMVGVGAQYIFKDIPADFWIEVAETSIGAFHMLDKLPSPDDGYPVQAWCAEMYVTQLLAMKHGYVVQERPEMDMVWANGPANWHTYGFYHNAGVTEPDDTHFCKIPFQTGFPPPQKVSRSSASFGYVEAIERAREALPEDLLRP